MTGRAGRGGAAAPEASWFGALEGHSPSDDAAAHSRLDRGESRDGNAADSRFLSRQARRIASTGQTGLMLLYRAFVAARAALSVVLLATEVLITWLAAQPRADLVLALCAAYAFAAVALWLMPELLGRAPATGTRLRNRQWLATIGLDLLVFATLHLLTDGSALNYSALLVLPALMAGVLTPQRQALGVSAAGTLVLLAAAWFNGGAHTPLLLTQAGLAGAGLFVVSLLAGELSGRLAREERTARGSFELARQQAQLNRLVLQEMQDGVMVVDRRGRVRAANPAVRLLLGEPQVTLNESFALTGVAAWEPLVLAVDRAFADGSWPESGRDVSLPRAATGKPGPRHGSTQMRLRVRFTQRQESSQLEEYCVLFLEDLRSVQARARQEKLAAMGRVSAGIAHEIRNPLAAILQANALLAEDANDAQARQLTRIVAENAERLKRIVDDVMEVAPGPQRAPSPLDASAQVAAICGEWARIAGLRLGTDSAVQIELPAQPLGVVFDGEHLRRVLVNLLDNALRHGSAAPGAVQVRLAEAGEGRALLTVHSDGDVIAPEVERHLFEPFFSTRSRGTGLGLYICRELCERYGASIDYRARAGTERHRNEFSVTMRRGALAASETRLPLSS
ncbi:MAG: PAS domain-containing protein [Methylibium sp.]|uniref:sensor histidine kinase n=1 Tax=Methylibium sp. TaxID=2067992 RepID=UPI0017C07FAE|nr:ATP-binding protein [Methylibium sp.]MBA3599463.1 PAS domain-containing protein [Methylibium sp.]